MTRESSQRLRTAALATPASILLVLGMAAPAGAAVSVSGNQVLGDAGPDVIVVTCSGGKLTASGAAGTGSACASTVQVFVHPGDGADFVDLAGVTAGAFPVLVNSVVYVEEDGASAADTVQGSPGSDNVVADGLDTVNGNEGPDIISGGQSVNGGLGDDTIIDFFGAGTAVGGPGDDRFVQVIAPLEGGTGFDSLDLDLDRSNPTTGADVVLRFTEDQLIVTTGPSSQSVAMSGLEQIYLTLFRKDAQTFDGSAFPGVQNVRGMSGVDTISGGVLDDNLHGGADNDIVTGNGGADVLHGGDGDDTVNARDGVADRVDCGAGVDTVVADAGDVVANCETVQLPPVAAPPVVTPPVAAVPVTGAISGPKAVTKPAKAKFRFASTTPGATFQCKVDAKAWKTCTSPYKVATKKLKPGKHKLLVRAVVGGAFDATPSKKVFTVRRS